MQNHTKNKFISLVFFVSLLAVSGQALSEIEGSCPVAINSARVDMLPNVLDWLTASHGGEGYIFLKDGAKAGYQRLDNVCIFDKNTQQQILCTDQTVSAGNLPSSTHGSVGRPIDEKNDFAIYITGFLSNRGNGAIWRRYLSPLNSGPLNQNKTFDPNNPSRLKYNEDFLLDYITENLVVTNRSRGPESCPGHTDPFNKPQCPSIGDYSLQNPEEKHDVNNDGRISPLDALIVINYLGERPPP